MNSVAQSASVPDRRPPQGARILLTTFGSLGDLHPYIALACELQRRGHHVTIATTENYRPNIETEGVAFHPLRPAVGELEDNPEMMQRIMHSRTGTEYILRQIVLPALKETYEDMKAALSGIDLLVTHPLTFAGPILAEQSGVRWVSSVLSPISMMSAYDFPLLAPSPAISRLRILGPGVGRGLLALGKKIGRPWTEPIRQLRAELGLPPGADPLFEGQHAPELSLALFSKLMGAPQKDWLPQIRQTGFLYYDKRSGRGMPPELTQFLDAGSPPLVFTLGSAGVMDAKDFYQTSALAATRIRRRAVLLTGRYAPNRPTELPPNVLAVDYAPYSELFPRAAAIISSSGIGTIAQGLRSGKPMLVLPFSHDQFDNADRIARLGVGRAIKRKAYTTLHAAAEIQRLIADTPYIKRAAEVKEALAQEDGLKTACDLIEARLPQTLSP